MSSAESGGGAAPAGWYPVDGGQRYWDGQQWTEHTAPAPSPGPAPPPGATASFPNPGDAPAPSPYGPGAVPMPMAGGPAAAYDGMSTSDERSMALLCHLLAIVTGFVGPLIVWLIKKDESPFLDHHGKEALNFQITMMIAWVVAILSLLILVGLLLIPILAIVGFVMPIVAGVAANRGELYRYPLTLRLIT